MFHHFTSSETHPKSGPGGAGSTRSSEFSLLSLAYILARRPFPDSTRSITGSSSHFWSQRSNTPSPARFVGRVGVTGRLRNPGRKVDGLRGEQYPEPVWSPHEGLVFPTCRLRIDSASPLTGFMPTDSVGDIGGDSDEGDTGGE